MMNAQMHIIMRKSIDDMAFDELDALRAQLRLPQTTVCELGEFNPASYGRWRRWARGEPNVSGPSRRSIKMLREILRTEVARQLEIADGSRSYLHHA